MKKMPSASPLGRHSKKNFNLLRNQFIALRDEFDKFVFEAESFDEARYRLMIRREMENKILDKFRLAADFTALDQIELPTEK